MILELIQNKQDFLKSKRSEVVASMNHQMNPPSVNDRFLFTKSHDSMGIVYAH